MRQESDKDAIEKKSETTRENVEANIEETKKKVEDNVHDVVEQAKQEVERGRVPWYRAFQRTRYLIGFNFVLFVLFAILAWYVYYNPVLPLDIMITREFQEQNLPWLKGLMIAVSWLGTSLFFSALIVLVTAAAFWLVGLRLESVLIVALSGVSALLNAALKLLINRPRPNARLVEIITAATGQSFPSGHVMSYVAFFGLLFSLGLILFKRDRWWQYALLIVPALFVVLVGPSRIYLGDHWASDVLGAYMISGLLLGISLWIYLSLKERGVLAPKRLFRRKRVSHPSNQPLSQHVR